MSGANTLTRHAAPGQYLGYALQPVRLCCHLLNCDKSTNVSLEYIEDVAVHFADGRIIFEQMKSALKTNPLADWSSDLWKAIRHWMEAIRNGEIEIEKSEFIYYVTPIKSGNFAQRLSDANADGEIAIATQIISDAFARRVRKPLGCEGDVRFFLNASESERVNFVKRFKIISHDGDPLVYVRERFRSVVEPSLLDDLCKSIIGIAKEDADNMIRKGGNAILNAGEFQTKIRSFVRSMNIPGLLISFSPLPSGVAVEDVIAARPTFVRQLDLIDANSDVRVRAVSDFLRASADRSIWADRGLIFPDNLVEWESGLLRRHDATNREVTSTLPHLAPQQRGHLIYDRCTLVQFPLEGRGVPEHFVPGSYNSLANDKRLGWHPDYARLLDMDE